MPANPLGPTVAVGELLWDLIPSGARLGGTTTNFAVLSARLGEDAALVSCVGEDDLGREALERLRAMASDPASRSHLDLTGIQISGDLPTGTVSVELDERGRPKYIIHGPVAWDRIALSADLVALAGRASVVCFGTLAQREMTSRTTIRSLTQAVAPQCIRVCDLNLRAPFATTEVLQWCMAHTDVLKVSDEEMPEVARLLGIPAAGATFALHPQGEDLTLAATDAARALLAIAPQCRLVALTLGPHGSLLADRQGTHRHHGFVVRVADTVGAGDAFTAGLAFAYKRGASLAQISEVANLCGSYVASQSGATPELPPDLLGSIQAALTQTDPARK